jgi:hypothetical protein
VSDTGEVHQHSGWLIPLAMMAVIAVLCGVILAYYLRPPPGSFGEGRPTAATRIVALTIHGLNLHVPARYIESRAARSGGDRETAALFAALPDMRGYSDKEAALFTGNGPDSPIVHLMIRADSNGLGIQSRLVRVYMPYIIDPKGETAPFGLIRYGFRPDSGYGRNDLYAAPGGGNLFLCERPAQNLPSPNCLAVDRPIADGVSLSYRFKRTQLSRWRSIAAEVNQLIAGFRK